MDPVVDLLGQGMAQGVIANQLMNQGQLNLGKMRPYLGVNGDTFITVYTGGDPLKKENWKVKQINTNATLRRDEWKALDDSLLEISRQRLGGIDDLVSKGLVYNLGNAMGTTVLEWHDVSDAMEAVVTMDGITRSKNDRVKFTHNYLPIPIIHVDYEINARVLSASRSLGNPLDTTNAERAARKVREKIEEMLFTNTQYNFGEKDARDRNSIYSYLNHPDRNQVELKKAWDASGTTPAEILKDVSDMKQASLDALHYGPWMLYVPSKYDIVLDQDYSVNGQSLMTLRERILKIAGIEGIKVVDKLTADNVSLVQMTSDVVRLVRGMGLQNVEWAVEGNMATKYKVMTIQVPQIRSDQNGRSGVTHLA
jgi:hypothetical protein